MTTNDENKYFEETLASQLGAKRDPARTKRRITYDCFHAVSSDGVVGCAREEKTCRVPV